MATRLNDYGLGSSKIHTKYERLSSLSIRINQKINNLAHKI
jgi:hypothetical protein